MRTGYLIVAVAVCMIVEGCTVLDEKVIPVQREPVADNTAPSNVIQQDSTSLERRFSTQSESDVNPLQTIVSLTQRYEELSRQTEQLRESKNALVLENSRFKQDAAQLQNKVAMLEAQIEQSNQLLQQSHVELSKWKADVLGFREEMRQAQAAQIAGIGKILRILGAEPSPAAAPQGAVQGAKQ